VSGLLRQTNLEVYNIAQTEEVRSESLRLNFERLDETMKKAGVNLVINEMKREEIAVTSTSELDLLQFTKPFVSNGCVMEGGWRSTIDVSGGSITLRLYLDGEIVDETTQDTAGKKQVELGFTKEVAAGEKMLKVKAFMSAGTGYISAGSLPTTTWVRELHL
jgi:hypothetical protein